MDPILLRQLQIDSKTENHLDITIIDGDTISIRDSRGRENITLLIPDLYGKRQLPSPQTIDLVGGLPNTTYYLYATEPVPPWGAESSIASAFRLIISTDGTLTYKHRLLFKLFTDGAGNIIGTSEEFPHYTTDELHVYVNAATGDDTNDGLTPATAKKTLQAGSNIIPFHIFHNVALHLEGVFDDENLDVEKFVARGKNLVVDGGDSVTVIADDSGSPWSADISSVSSIGLSTLAWTPNQYAGYWLEILSGPAIGQTRLIQSHDATTITPNRNFSTDPLAGAQFRIVRPTTTIGGLITAAQDGEGILHLQRLYFNTTGYFISYYNNGILELSHLLSDYYGGTLSTAFNARHCSEVYCYGNYINPNTFVFVTGTTNPYVGISARGTYVRTMFHYCDQVVYYGSYSTALFIFKCKQPWMSNGSRTRFFYVHGATALSFEPSWPVTLLPFRSSPGYANTVFGPGLAKIFPGTVNLPCIYCYNCSLGLQNVDIQGSLHDGMELIRSLCILDGGISSTINANAGVWAHSGSIVHLRSTNTPAVTGTAVGDLSVDDVVQISTWAAITGGTPVANTTEMVVAKNYISSILA